MFPSNQAPSASPSSCSIAFDADSGRRSERSRIQIEIRRIVTEVGEVSDYRLRDRFVEDLGLG
jgi:hypothetical protein